MVIPVIEDVSSSLANSEVRCVPEFIAVEQLDKIGMSNNFVLLTSLLVVEYLYLYRHWSYLKFVLNDLVTGVAAGITSSAEMTQARDDHE